MLIICNIYCFSTASRRDTLPRSTIRGVVNFCSTKINMLCQNRLLEHVWLCVLQNCYIIGNVKNSLASRPPRSCRQLHNKPHRLARQRATHTRIFKDHDLSMNQII